MVVLPRIFFRIFVNTVQNFLQIHFSSAEIPSVSKSPKLLDLLSKSLKLCGTAELRNNTCLSEILRLLEESTDPY